MKINGYRIEIGEVEAALRASHGVKEAVVLPIGGKFNKVLVAFLKCEDGGLSRDDIHKAVKELLPKYSLPSSIHLLHGAGSKNSERLWPVSANGKVDRKALQKFHTDQGPQGRSTNKSFVAPRTEAETAVAQAFAKSLSIDVEHVGAFGDFFDLGGHSLSVVALIGALQASQELAGLAPVGLKAISVLDVMQQRTVEAVAEWLLGHETARGGAALTGQETVLDNGARMHMQSMLALYQAVKLSDELVYSLQRGEAGVSPVVCLYGGHGLPYGSQLLPMVFPIPLRGGLLLRHPR